MTTRGSNFAGVSINEFDFTSVTYATTGDTYKFYRGGTSGTLVATVNLIYSNSTKATLTQVIKT